MERVPEFRKEELPTAFELLEVLHSSLDVRTALSSAYPLLCKLVPTDYGALCTSRHDSPILYDWAVAEMPDAFFRGYGDIAQHDFVRASVATKPNIVISDIDMMPDRAQWPRHPLYDYCHSNGLPIERALAVMFSSEPTWHGGLTLYRGRNVPFSEREVQILQFFAPYFSNAVANCRRYTERSQWASFLEASLMQQGTAVIVFSSSLKELARSASVDGLLDRCFGKERRGDDGLPETLGRQLMKLALHGFPPEPPAPWLPAKRGAGLVVKFVPIVKESGTQWVIFMDEVPLDWRGRLTPAEIDVAVRVAQGWDNELVANDLGNTELTIKTHLYRIFNKLGISTRTALTARFASRI